MFASSLICVAGRGLQPRHVPLPAAGIVVRDQDQQARSVADVLQNDALREGIKAFTDWPTIPQLYVKGEFVGGADIVREMFQSGELKSFLTEQGVLSA